jgi:hypothetical protein
VRFRTSGGVSACEVVIAVLRNDLVFTKRYFSWFSILFLYSVMCVCAWGQRSCKWPEATFLAPGNAVFPGEVASGANPGMLVGQPLTSTFSITTSAGTTTGTIVSAVYIKGGTLDFYYQVSNDLSSALPLVAVEATSFTGFRTCVAFRADGSDLPGFQNGINPPVTATSSNPPPAGGFEIGFQFYPPAAPPTEIAPGSTSLVLIISTNATHANDKGAAIVLDQAAGANTSAYQPIL